MSNNIQVDNWVEVIINLKEYEDEHRVVFKQPHQYFSKVTRIADDMVLLSSVSDHFFFFKSELKKVEL